MGLIQIMVFTMRIILEDPFVTMAMFIKKQLAVYFANRVVDFIRFCRLFVQKDQCRKEEHTSIMGDTSLHNYLFTDDNIDIIVICDIR